MILLIGLAVGVDYSLFYLRREREERAAGRSEEAALEAAAATSGPRRADLRLHGDDRDGGHVLRRRSSTFELVRHRHDPGGRRRRARLAHRAARVLSKLGDRVDKGRDPVPRRSVKARRPASHACGRASLDRVLRRPLVSALVSGGLLVALAAPGARHAHGACPASTRLPRDLAVMQTYDRIQAAFPGRAASRPTWSCEADDVRARRGPRPRSRSCSAEARRQPDLLRAAPSVEVSPDGTVAERRRSRSPATAPTTGPNAALDELRDELVPATLRAV